MEFRLIPLLLQLFWTLNIVAKSSYLDELSEIDLLEAVKIPFEDPSNQYIELGADGFPAVGVRPGSKIRTLFSSLFPSKEEEFYPEFSILFTLKLAQSEGGYLFAVLNPLETVAELAISVRVLAEEKSEVSLFYTDPSKTTSESVASFNLPTSFARWGTVTLKVTKTKVTIGLECQELASSEVLRRPERLQFQTDSVLYIGQGGPTLGGALHVSVGGGATRRRSVGEREEPLPPPVAGGSSVYWPQCRAKLRIRRN